MINMEAIYELIEATSRHCKEHNVKFNHELVGHSIADLKNSLGYVNKNKDKWSDEQIAVYEKYIAMICDMGIQK